MKVVLAMPTIPELSSIESQCYPLGLMSIASYVSEEQSWLEVEIVCGPMSARDILEQDPDVVGLSLLTPFFTIGCRLAEELRAQCPTLAVVIGGHHISYLPGCLPLAATCGVIGAGEVAFAEICRILQNTGQLSVEALMRVPNIVTWANSERIFSERVRSLVSVSNTLHPLVNYDICTLTDDKPVTHHIVTSYGCPHRCRFCSSSPFWNPVSYPPIEAVVEQVAYLSHRGIARACIYDDLLTHDRNRLSELCRQLRLRHLDDEMDFFCWIDGSDFDESTASLLISMGVSRVCCAIESASPRVYRWLKGEWSTPAQNVSAVRVAERMGLAVSISCIVGSTHETEDEMWLTYDCLDSLPINDGCVSLLKVFPGTRLWTEAMDRCLVTNDLPDWSWTEIDDPLAPHAIVVCSETQPDRIRYLQEAIEALLRRKAAPT